MATKWFDLSTLGAKLERDRDDTGVLSLKLTFDEPEKRTSDATTGLYRARKEADAQGGRVASIRVSPNAPGSTVHEMAHAIDFAFPGGADKYDFLLEETGIAEKIRASVAARDGFSPEFAEYLTSPQEMFARTFDAAMVNKCLEDSDVNCRALGGSLMSTTKFDYAPKRDFEATNVFVARLREWNEGYAPKSRSEAEFTKIGGQAAIA